MASMCLEVFLCCVDCNNKGNPSCTMIVLLPALKGYVDLAFKYSTKKGW
jgi:hypothetical protein